MRARVLAAVLVPVVGAVLWRPADGGEATLRQQGRLEHATASVLAGSEPILPALSEAALLGPAPAPAPPDPNPPGAQGGAGPPRPGAAEAEAVPAPPPLPAPPRPALAGVVDARLADPRLAGTTVGLSVWIDGLGEVAGHNPDLALLPASNQKLFTAMGVLAGIPAGDQLFTEVRAAGTQQGPNLVGHLVLIGGGDPTIRLHGPHSLDELAAGVRARGITHVTGELLGDETRYDSLRGALGWRPEHVPTYIGPLSALVVDRNQHRADAAFAGNPLPGNLARFRVALMRAGVTVAGPNAWGPAPPGSAVLVSMASPPVGELVGHMLRESDNLVAELLLKELGLRRRARGTTVDGVAAADELLRELGVPLAGASADGSGLSRSDFRSAREWRLLLQAAAGQPWGPHLTGSLPVAGRTGTLARRLRGTAAEANVRAKTGWIDEARALSGYFTTAAGRGGTFSVIVNGTTPRSPVLSAVDDLVAAIAADRS
jgi:D-alanyl-D-alanine carboxypeptidase/D-alanyl-D-alanine-endopeptidase (penicillin-binding protein 4)